ncbi:unnamed protein product [Darwinula stevensoni]|uniref:Uncharacterized protein n=1 Tax=Darwinula stevensoni TaxID=69355 RepID=A0A7R8X5U1_9CRUS|nr:unnamed protein product [Darwinula stevensoni]CAG0881315.1 unnamed protein product [Darwinula stevensoni]
MEVAYIKEREGFLGLYSGVKPKLISVIICFSASHQASLKLNPKSARQAEDINALAVSTCKEVTIRSFGIILSHPFQGKYHRMRFFSPLALIMLLQLHYNAQVWEDGERKDEEGMELKESKGLFDSLFEVYHTNGILGFFSGLIPRLLGEALTIMIANVLIHCIKTWSRPSQTFQYIPPIINVFHFAGTCTTSDLSHQQKGTHGPLFPSILTVTILRDGMIEREEMSVEVARDSAEAAAADEAIGAENTFATAVVVRTAENGALGNASRGGRWARRVMNIAHHLVAGRPPLMPSYKSWLDCWDHLKGQRQLSRGSNVLFRRFLGPSSYLVPGSDSVNQRYPLQKDM